MYLYVEQWKLRPKWTKLPKQERAAYIASLDSVLEDMDKAGIELVGFAFNEVDAPYRANCDYFAVWKMPRKSLIKKFEKIAEEIGWHKYFKQVNARGRLVDAGPALANMANLKAP